MFTNIKLFSIDVSSKYLFLCKSTGDFINDLYICDNKKDCLNGEDEFDCKFQFNDYFVCAENQQKILYKFVCDHVNDCPDASDEKNCGKIKQNLQFLLEINSKNIL